MNKIVKIFSKENTNTTVSKTTSFCHKFQWDTQSFTINHLVDISIIWFTFCNFLHYLSGTKTIEIIKGIACLMLLKMLAESLNLTNLSFIMNQTVKCGEIAVIVIFQPEIRKFLEKLGRNIYIKRKPIHFNDKMITEIDAAVQHLAERKIGALITFQRHVNLEEYIATGIKLDAEISEQLLISIFAPNTPLHDGAVIIKNGRIIVSSAYLPSSDNMQIPKRFGTRHRAAIGMSAVSDAVTVVVSEETGEVSITANNVFYDNVSREEYLNILSRELIQSEGIGV